MLFLQASRIFAAPESPFDPDEAVSEAKEQDTFDTAMADIEEQPGVPSRSRFLRFSRDKLQEEARKRNLDDSGTKEDLVRLHFFSILNWKILPGYTWNLVFDQIRNPGSFFRKPGFPFRVSDIKIGYFPHYIWLFFAQFDI